MTTASWATRVRHDSDAVFREWGSEFNTKLAAIGLVQTSDTGQINWTTVTRPAANTVGGYEIWRFADSMQSTAPIFMKVEYGTGASTSAPLIKITVGTGSNGSGTITGTALTAAQNVANGNIGLTVDTLYNSYACHTAGFFGISWKIGSNPEGFFCICRTCDSSGTPDGVGALVLWYTGSSPNSQALRFSATAKAYTLRNGANAMQLCLMPQGGDAGSSLVGSDIQAFMCWTITPRVQPLLGLCGVVSNEVSAGVTFSATLVGSTAHTYIATTAGTTSFSITSNSGINVRPAMIWE